MTLDNTIGSAVIDEGELSPLRRAASAVMRQDPGTRDQSIMKLLNDSRYECDDPDFRLELSKLQSNIDLVVREFKGAFETFFNRAGILLYGTISKLKDQARHHHLWDLYRAYRTPPKTEDFFKKIYKKQNKNFRPK